MPGAGGSVAQAQAAYTQWQAWLSQPAQVSARQESQTEFEGESAPQALSTDSSNYPGWIGQPGYTVPAPAQGKIVGAAGPHAELVQNSDGSGGVMVSSLPLDGTTPAGASAPLNLTLSGDGVGSYQPQSSLVPVTVPSASTGELSFPQAGFGVSFAAGAAVSGQQQEGTVFYANVGGRADDTDAVVDAVPQGAEVTYILRSAESPQSQVLTFELPSGWSLAPSPLDPGNVSVLNATGTVEGTVLAPVATDAQGQPVVAAYQVKGTDQLVLTVSDQGGGYAFPIEVDPAITIDTGSGTSTFAGWQTNENDANIKDKSFSSDGAFGWEMTTGKTYTIGDRGWFTLFAPSNANIYELLLDGVSHVVDNVSDLQAGIEYPPDDGTSDPWYNSSIQQELEFWENLTKGTSGTESGLTDANALNDNNFEFCTTWACVSYTPDDGDEASFKLYVAVNSTEGSNVGEDYATNAIAYVGDGNATPYVIIDADQDAGTWISTTDSSSGTYTPNSWLAWTVNPNQTGLGVDTVSLSDNGTSTGWPASSETGCYVTSSTATPANTVECTDQPVNVNVPFLSSLLVAGVNTITATATGYDGVSSVPDSQDQDWIGVDNTAPTLTASGSLLPSGGADAVTSLDPGQMGQITVQASGMSGISSTTGELDGQPYSLPAGSGCMSFTNSGCTATSTWTPDPSEGGWHQFTATAVNGAMTPSTTGVTDTFADIAPPIVAAPNGYDAGDVVTATAAPFETDSYGSTTPTVTGWQWQSCTPSGLSCVDIPGATASQYTLTSADVGSTVQVVESVDTPAGTTPATMQIGSVPDTSDLVEPASGEACTDSWNAVGAGLWSDASDWYGDRVPGAGDIVCIRSGYPDSDTSGAQQSAVTVDASVSQAKATVTGLDAYGASVTVDDGATLEVTEPTHASGVGNIQVGTSGGASDAGTLKVDGWLTVEGNTPAGSGYGGLDWINGTISGGGTLDLTGGAVSAIQPGVSSDSLTLNQTDLVNRGWVSVYCTVATDTQNDLTAIIGEGGATLDNEGGSLKFHATDTSGPSNGCGFEQHPGDSTPSTFINNGTFFWDGNDSDDAIDIGWGFDSTEAATVNNAIVDLYGGEATIDGQTTSVSGHWMGASLQFYAGGQYAISDPLADFGSQDESQADVTVWGTPGQSQGAPETLAAALSGSSAPTAPALTVTGGAWSNGWISDMGQLTLGQNGNVTTIANLSYNASQPIDLDGTVNMTAFNGTNADFDQASPQDVTNIYGPSTLTGDTQITGASGAAIDLYGPVNVSQTPSINTTNGNGSGPSVDLLGAVSGSGNFSVDVDGSFYEQGGLTVTGNFTVTAGQDVQLSGAVTELGNVSVTAAGTADISGAVNATDLDVSANDISIEGNVGQGGSDTPPVDAISLTSPGNIDVSGQLGSNGSITLAGGGNTTFSSGWNSADNWILDGENVNNQGVFNVADQLLAENGAEFINAGTVYAENAIFEQPTDGPGSRFVNTEDGQLEDWNNPATPANTISIPYSGGGSVTDAYLINDTGSGEYGGNNPAAPNMVAADCDQATDCGNGDWSTSATDLSVAALGGPLALTRQYSSRLATGQASPGMFGYGWVTPFEQRLTIQAPSYEQSGTATVQTATGSTATFTLQGTTYTAAAGIYSTLTANDPVPGEYTYVQPDQTTTVFTAAGLPISVSNRQNQVTTYSYNGQGQLTDVFAPCASCNGAYRSLHFTYIQSGPGTGLVGTATVEAGGVPVGVTMTYGYDANDNLTTVSESSGPNNSNVKTTAWTYEYDEDQGISANDLTDLHELTTLTNADGDSTSVRYEAGYVTGVQQPGKPWEIWTYQLLGTPSDNTGGETIQTSPAGNVTTIKVNAQDEPVETDYADGSKEFETYYSDNDLESETDGNNGTTNYWYDQWGNIDKEENPDGQYTTWSYDSQRDLLNEVLPSGETTTYNNYDAGGEPASVEVAEPATLGTLSETTSMTYYPDEQLKTSTTPDGGETQYTYDAYGDPATVTGPATADVPSGAETTYGYDSEGRQTCETTPRVTAMGQTCLSGQVPNAETSTYDALGDLVQSTSPTGKITSYTYWPDQQVEQVTGPNSNTSNVTTYQYFPNGQLESTTTGTLSSATSQNNVYDADDNLTSQTSEDSNGNAGPGGYSYTYNNMDQLWTSTPGNGSEETTTYTYDGDGNVRTITYPQSNGSTEVTTYGYDGENRVKSISYSDGETPVVNSYWPDGQLDDMSDASGDSTYTYDGLDRLTSVCIDATSFVGQCPGGRTIGYQQYNGDNEPTQITYPNGQFVTQGFNEADQLTSVKDWLGNTTSFSYDADGNLSATTFPTGTNETDNYSYGLDDALGSITMNETGHTNPLASITLNRYDDDLISSQTTSGTPGLPAPTSDNYTYTEQQELASDTPGGGTQLSYSYDQSRDMTKLAGSTALNYNADGELTSGPAGNYQYNTLGERTGLAPTQNGNCTSCYTYNADQNLTQATVPNGSGTSTVNYTYNGDGQLESSTTGTTTTQFTWADTQSTPNLLSAGSESYIYGPGGNAIEQISGTTAQYLHEDQLGSTRMITDANGNVIGTFTYSPYGTLLGSTGTATSLLGYAGEYTDPTTGLVYDQARWYDPTSGQFMVVDPKVEGTWQPYGYANDDPVDQTDPTGQKGGPIGCLGRTVTASCRRVATARSKDLVSISWSDVVSIGVLIATIPLDETGAGEAIDIEVVTEADGTRLYRAVTNAEAADIEATGTYRIGGASGAGKYFSDTQEQAESFVSRGWADRVTSSVFSDAQLGNAARISPVTEGDGYFIYEEEFPHGPVTFH